MSTPLPPPHPILPSTSFPPGLAWVLNPDTRLIRDCLGLFYPLSFPELPENSGIIPILLNSGTCRIEGYLGSAIVWVQAVEPGFQRARGQNCCTELVRGAFRDTWPSQSL